MSTAIKDYASITVSDTEPGQLHVSTAASDTLDDDSLLSKVAGLVMTEIQSGEVDPDIAFDAERVGEALLVFEEDDDGDIGLQIIVNPTVTLASGEASPSQALVFTALRSIEHEYGIGLFELVSAQFGS